MKSEPIDEGLIKDRYELLLQELQNLLTFGYLIVIILGVIFEVGYYRAFDINIFEYATVSDFLLAPFRRPISLVILGLSGLYVCITYPLDVWFSKKWPRLYRVLNFGLVRSDDSRVYRNIMFSIMALVLIVVFAFQIGDNTSKGLLQAKDNLRIQFATDRPDFYGKKIGQTSAYLFVMDSAAQVQIYPIASQVLVIEPLH